MVAALEEVARLEDQSRKGLALTRGLRARYPIQLPAAHRQWDDLEQIWRLCLEQADVLRRQANLGLAQASDDDSGELLAHRMSLYSSDVLALRKRIRNLAARLDAS